MIIGDGAKWIWDYADTYHPYAIQILDYYHASEYLGNALSSINADKREKKLFFAKLENGEIQEIIKRLKKQAGMHWKKKNVQSIASVKVRYESGRWDEVIEKYLRAA